MSIPDAQQKFALVSLIFRLETFIKLRNIIQSFNIIVYNSGKGYLFVYILFYSVHVKQAFGITEKKEVHSKSYFNIECKLCKSINTTIVLIFSRISVYYWLFKNDHLERTEEHAIWSILVVIIWSLLRERWRKVCCHDIGKRHNKYCNCIRFNCLYIFILLMPFDKHYKVPSKARCCVNALRSANLRTSF